MERYMHKKMWNKKDDQGDVGIGTMIVFIAMVLVASVAASVLINTANQVREQARSTGEQAINNVASGFNIPDAVAAVNQTTKDSIDSLTIYIRLVAGSPPINLDNVAITITSDALNMFLAYGSSISSTSYTVSRVVNISDLAWTTGSHIIGQGDLAKITVSNSVLALGIGHYADVEIKIIPAYGQTALIHFYTGDSFPSENYSLM
jgi:archaellin